jgi:signal transduction histidine kinase
VATESEPRAGRVRLAPAGWLRLPRRTARLRLTLLYGGLSMMLGTLLLVFIFVVGKRTTTVAVAVPSRLKADALNGVPFVLRSVAGAKISAVHQQSADLARLLASLWLGLAITTFGSAFIGWFAAGRVLRPVRAITTTARTISAGNLHERLVLRGPDDEFRQLGETLNDLLARLQASFDAQRRFVANASHELRTPLTVERTLLQVALADPDATVETLRAMCRELLAAGVEQEALLEGLLTLASSERGLEQRERLDLSVLARAAVDGHALDVEHLGLRLRTALEPAPAIGDPVLIGRLAANLIDNAVDHNVPGGEVEIRTGVDDGRSTLTVVNSGAVIPAAEVARLLEPFQRLEGGREADAQGHHGLGLSIVRAIADAHSAVLTVNARPAGGLVVTVRFAPTP